jgi:hypothetical protein
VDRIRSIVILIAAMLCADPRIVACDVACKYESYEYGTYKNKKCRCYDEFEYSDLVSKKIKRTLHAPLQEDDSW